MRERERIILKRAIRSSPYLPREYLMRHQQRGEKKFLGKEFWNAREWKWGRMRNEISGEG